MAIDGMAIMNFVGLATEEIIQSKYARSIITLLIFFIAARLLTWVTEKYILKVTAKTKSEVDDFLVRKTHGPVSLLLFILGIKLAIVPLKLEGRINTIFRDIISTLAIMVFSYLLITIFDVIIKAWIKNRAVRKAAEIDENLIKISTKTSRVIFFILALLFILNIWDVHIGPLLASLGIIGIAVAFGLQNTLGNIFGGVSLLLDRSIKVGDIVKLGEDTSGTVIDVGLRSTKIRTWDNEVIIIPNGKLAGENIKNYVLPDPSARIEVPFSVAYGSNVDEVKKVVMGEIKKLDNLDRGHDPLVMFLEMGPSSLNFKAFIWIKSYKERFMTKEKLTCMIYNTLNKNKITIPFPQMDVHLGFISKKGKKSSSKAKIKGTSLRRSDLEPEE